VRSRRWLGILSLAAAYTLAGKLGLALQLAHGLATPVWAPTGIALAALLIFGRRLWPGITLGALVVNATAPAPLAFSALAAAGNTATVLLALWLIERAGGLGAMERFIQVARLVGAALVSPVVSASVGTAALLATGAIPRSDVDTTWWVWWLGDSLGFLLVTSFLIAWAPVRRPAITGRGLEAALLAIGLVTSNLAAFSHWNLALGAHPLAYLAIPFVIWAALRFGLPGATLGTLLTSGFALWGAGHHTGPLGAAPMAQVLVWWQVYSVVIAIASLAVAGVATERLRALQALRWSEAEMRAAHDAAVRAEAEVRVYSATLEQRVAERTAALSAQNDRMIEFSYTISHDLRGPVRAIRGFADALLEESGDAIGAAGREYATRIRDAATRMDSLIQQLLAYSRLGNVELAHQPVSLEGAAGEAIRLLSSELSASGGSVDNRLAEELPRVMAHEPTLVQVVVNLLGNAVKFAAPGRRPIVTLRAERNGGSVRLWVEDNGVGIAPEHHERIFRVFERLEAAEDGGHGIGLAMVKRAVERMGGAVGVESAVGSGSRFWVELATARQPAVENPDGAGSAPRVARR
jgi:signal transduction histidine kinase